MCMSENMAENDEISAHLATGFATARADRDKPNLWRDAAGVASK